MPQKQKYDICLINFGDASSDARLINMIKVLKSAGKSLYLVCGSVDVHSEVFEGIKIFTILESQSGRVRKLWPKFYNEVRKIKASLQADHYLASDLYSLPVAVKLSKNYNSKVIYDSREIYSALGPLFKYPLKQRFIAGIEKYYIKSVKDIIVSGQLDADYLRNYFNTNAKYHVIMNLPGFKEIKKSNYLSKKFNLTKDTKIIIYQGVILRGRGIGPAIRALKYLDDFCLVLIGDSPEKEHYLDTAEREGVLEKLFIHEKVPYETLLEITASADVGLCFIKPISFSYELALPNKLFEYIMAGIPSLVSDLPAMRDIVNKHKIGALLSVDANSKEIAEKLEFLTTKSSSEKFKSTCEKASKELNYENQAEELLKIFE